MDGREKLIGGPASCFQRKVMDGEREERGEERSEVEGEGGGAGLESSAAVHDVFGSNAWVSMSRGADDGMVMWCMPSEEEEKEGGGEGGVVMLMDGQARGERVRRREAESDSPSESVIVTTNCHRSRGTSEGRRGTEQSREGVWRG